MAFLLDAPAAVRRDLSARWGVAENTDLLYRAMTEPGALRDHLRALGPGAESALRRLGRGPASFEDLLAGLLTSRERLAELVDGLAALGLVLREPIGDAPPRPARAPFGEEALYVPPDVAEALAGD